MRETIPNVTINEIIVLIVSGIIGIAVGDTTYFRAVQMIGARRALALLTLAPPLAALISLFFLGEKLPVQTWFGIILTAGGVMWVVTENSREEESVIVKQHILPGITLGVVSAFCQAAGVVMTRSVLIETNLSALQSTVIRLVPALALLAMLIKLFSKNRIKTNKVTHDKRLIGLIFLSSFIGAYFCLWLQQIAIANAPAGIVQTLISTSPIFILPMLAIRGEKISFRAIVGAIVAIFGITLVFQLFG